MSGPQHPEWPSSCFQLLAMVNINFTRETSKKITFQSVECLVRNSQNIWSAGPRKSCYYCGQNINKFSQETKYKLTIFHPQKGILLGRYTDTVLDMNIWIVCNISIICKFWQADSGALDKIFWRKKVNTLNFSLLFMKITMICSIYSKSSLNVVALDFCK